MYEVIGDTRKLSEEAWLELRKGGIGGSDSAAACGKCPWTTRLELYDYKTKAKKRKFSPEATKRMEKGKKLEPLIIDHFFATHEDLKRLEFNYMIRSTKYNWMLANLDGAYMVNGKKGVLEVKTARCNFKTFKDKWKERPPLNYYFQAQHYLAVTGWDEATLYAHIELEDFDGNLVEVKIMEYHMPRNEEFIDFIIKETKYFFDAWKTEDRIAILNTL